MGRGRAQRSQRRLHGQGVLHNRHARRFMEPWPRNHHAAHPAPLLGRDAVAFATQLRRVRVGRRAAPTHHRGGRGGRDGEALRGRLRQGHHPPREGHVAVASSATSSDANNAASTWSNETDRTPVVAGSMHLVMCPPGTTTLVTLTLNPELEVELGWGDAAVQKGGKLSYRSDQI